MTSEDYFGSMAFVGVVKGRTRGQDITLDTENEAEAEYPSSLLEPQRLQGISREFETSLFASPGHDSALITSELSTDNQWTLSRLYSNQRIGPAEAIADHVVNTLQLIPTGQRIQVYVSLLRKLEEKVRAQRKQPLRGGSSPAQELPINVIGIRNKEGDEESLAEVVESADAPEEPLYETASAEQWSRMFQQWASTHRRLPYEADDSREAIYQDRGK